MPQRRRSLVECGLAARLAGARTFAQRAARLARPGPHWALPVLTMAGLAVLAVALQPAAGAMRAATAPSARVAVTSTAPRGYLILRSAFATADSAPSFAQRQASDRGRSHTDVTAETAAATSAPAATSTPPPTSEPTPEPTTEPTPEPLRPFMLEVAAGDTIAGLAKTFGISSETILWANDLSAGEILKIGQKLTILPISGVLHTVQPGDTLNRIAGVYGVSPESIVTTNGLTAPDNLPVGQELIIPGGRPPRPPAPPTPEPQAVAKAAAPVAPVDPSKGQEISAIAAQYLGRAYTSRGASPATGFDCSGFAYWVYSQAGVSIPRGLSAQVAAGPAVPFDQLQPGDLVFFRNTFTTGLSHVGIYVGNGLMIHAASPKRGVTTDDLRLSYWATRYYGANRPW